MRFTLYNFISILHCIAFGCVCVFAGFPLGAEHLISFSIPIWMCRSVVPISLTAATVTLPMQPSLPEHIMNSTHHARNGNIKGSIALRQWRQPQMLMPKNEIVAVVDAIAVVSLFSLSLFRKILYIRYWTYQQWQTNKYTVTNRTLYSKKKKRKKLWCGVFGIRSTNHTERNWTLCNTHGTKTYRQELH